ncbi:hypothetical protein LJC42_08845, partial [Eubacteriales bacterium OttesenSCG-928-K08]|nr:hypothetical protein [Eubacteriales bacterium OttesenSCG-928-K08]
MDYSDMLRYTEADRMQIINTLHAVYPHTIEEMFNTNAYALLDELVTGFSPVVRDNPETSNVTDMESLKAALLDLMVDGINLPAINSVLQEFVGGM